MEKDFDELEILVSKIEDLEKQLAEAKKNYENKKYGKLRKAIEERKKLDKVIQEELEAAGYVNPFSLRFYR